MIILVGVFNLIIAGVLWYDVSYHALPPGVALLVQAIVGFFLGLFVTLQPQKERLKPDTEEDLTRRQIFEMTAKAEDKSFCPGCGGLGWVEADVGQLFECDVCHRKPVTNK